VRPVRAPCGWAQPWISLALVARRVGPFDIGVALNRLCYIYIWAAFCRTRSCTVRLSTALKRAYAYTPPTYFRRRPLYIRIALNTHSLTLSMLELPSVRPVRVPCGWAQPWTSLVPRSTCRRRHTIATQRIASKEPTSIFELPSVRPVRAPCGWAQP